MDIVKGRGLNYNAWEATQPYRHYPGRKTIKKDIFLYPGLEGVDVNSVYPLFHFWNDFLKYVPFVFW